MPRYFFHLYNDIESTDAEGIVLPDIEAARAHACLEAREMIIQEIREKGSFHLGHRIEVEDKQHGEIVLVVKFGDCVKVNA